MEIERITALLKIADQALSASDAADARRNSNYALKAAYDTYKSQRGIEFVERDSNDWRLMLASAEPEFRAHKADRRTERNARRRLDTAIRAYQRAEPSSTRSADPVAE